MPPDSSVDMNLKADKVTMFHDASNIVPAKVNNNEVNNKEVNNKNVNNDMYSTKPKSSGYLDTIVTLLDEYRILFKSLRNSNRILIKRNACLQAELAASLQREAFSLHLAYHDGLTGLPNRSLLHDRFLQAISHADRQQKPLAILMLDLDKFKIVNDKLGHASGDELLKLVAQRLSSSVRGADTACRFGGDEFVIMLPFIDNASSAGIVATEIGRRLSEPYIIDEHKIHIAVSLGMAIYPNDGLSLDELMKKADTAMYSTKGLGHNTLITASEKNIQHA